MTYLSDDEENCNIPELSPAQQRLVIGEAMAWAFGKTIPRHFRFAWRSEFMRRWKLKDDAPIVLSDIDARIIAARPVEAVFEAEPDAIELPAPERSPHAARAPPGSNGGAIMTPEQIANALGGAIRIPDEESCKPIFPVAFRLGQAEAAKGPDIATWPHPLARRH
jgi:hypothetical protein